MCLQNPSRVVLRKTLRSGIVLAIGVFVACAPDSDR